MLDCSRDGSYRRGRATRALTFRGYSNVFDYRTTDSGRRMDIGECSDLGIPPTCKCVINPAQMDHYLNPNTPLDDIPKGIRHYIVVDGGKRRFEEDRVFVLEGGKGIDEDVNSDSESSIPDDGW